MSEHSTLPFSEQHTARLRYGLSTALPVHGGTTAPEGVGDIYAATDTGEIYICFEFPVWTLYATGGGGGLTYEGTKRNFDTDVNIPGDDSSTYLDWPTTLWVAGAGGFGSGSGFLQPELGFYQYQLNLILENTTPARWHIEASYDGGDFTSEALDFHTDGGGDSVILHLSSQYYALKNADDGGYFYIYLYQNAGVDQAVRAYSSIMFQRIGDPL